MKETESNASVVRFVLFSSGGGFVEAVGDACPSLADLSDRCADAEVTALAPGTVHGRFAGIEMLREEDEGEGSSAPAVRPVLKLVTAEGTRSIPVSLIERLRFADEGLERDLQETLDSLIAARSDCRKVLELHILDYHGQPPHFTVQDPDRQLGTLVPIPRSPLRFGGSYVYGPDERADHASRAVYLINRLEQKLLDCELAVYEAETPAGNARIEELCAGGRSLIRYAPDPDTPVRCSQSSESRIVEARIAGTRLQLKRVCTYTHEYSITNSGPQNIFFIVEYPFSARRRVVEPMEFVEKTPELRRFRFRAFKKSVRTFAVREEETTCETVDILTAPVPSLEQYAGSADIPQPVRDALSRAIQLRSENKSEELVDYLKSCAAG